MGLLDKVGAKGAIVGHGARAAGVGLGVLALSLTDLDDKAGLSNTAMFAMLGLLGGPWGAALGAATGAVVDAAKANNDFASSIERVNDLIADQPDEFDAQRKPSRRRGRSSRGSRMTWSPTVWVTRSRTGSTRVPTRTPSRGSSDPPMSKRPNVTSRRPRRRSTIWLLLGAGT